MYIGSSKPIGHLDVGYQLAVVEGGRRVRRYEIEAAGLHERSVEFANASSLRLALIRRCQDVRHPREVSVTQRT